jgi:hypothetical protein
MNADVFYYWKRLCCLLLLSCQFILPINEASAFTLFIPGKATRSIRHHRIIRKFFLQDESSGSFNMTSSGRGGGVPPILDPLVVPTGAAVQAEGAPPSAVRNNFGDIMSPTVEDADVLFRDGLVTSTTQSLAKMYNLPNPLDRMAVTANGNLQRLVSSYYDAPVTVVVDHCRLVVGSDGGVWDRRVKLQVYGQTFCVADSTVQVHSEYCRELVRSGQVGLGQLFRHLNILPEFALRAAGPTEDGGFWRHYTLACAEVSCSIQETFIPGVWELELPKENHDY